MKVCRYLIPGGDPDRLRVHDDERVYLDVPMGPGGPLHSRSSADAKPWFYTGSPYGAEILALAKERGVIDA